MAEYIALIYKDAGSDFGVSFPDFPGCVTAGSTLDEARAMAAEALALHLEGLEEDGVEIPAPSSLDEVRAEAENRDGVVMLVPAPERAEKSIRINVMVPVKALKLINRYVKEKGWSRSRFLVDAAERAMSVSWEGRRFSGAEWSRAVSREAMAEAVRLARKAVKEVIREEGGDPSRIEPSEITEAAKELIERDKTILEEAKANIEKLRKTTKGRRHARRKEKEGKPVGGRPRSATRRAAHTH
jgi:predicted RNase H-like HicB family nuclease